MEAEIPQHSKEVARGSFWSLAGNASFKLVSFFYVVLIARAASQDDIGVFYLALSVISLIWVFSDLGISGAFIRYVPYFEGRGEPGKIRNLLKFSYGFITILSLCIVAALFIFADAIGALYSNASLPEAIRILSAYILLGNLFRLNYLYLQGIRDIKRSQLFQNIQNFLKLAFTLILFYLFGASVVTISAAFVLSFLFALAASSLPVLRSAAKAGGGAGLSRRELIYEIVPLGITVAIIQSFSTIISSSDRLIIGYMANPLASASLVAVYSMATTLATVLMVFPGSVGNIFLPLVSRLSGMDDAGAMREVMATAQRWSLFISLPIAVVMMAFSGDMLAVFYGPQYASGAAAMSIFTFGLIFSVFSLMASLALTAMRLVRLELYVAAAGAIVNIALNFLLIPVLGIEGAAIASAVSFAISASLLNRYARSRLGYTNPPESYKLVAAAISSFVLIALAKPALSEAALWITVAAGSGDIVPKAIYLAYLCLLICASGALFVLMSLALRCFREEDVALVRRAMERAGIPAPLVQLMEKVASHGVHGKK